MHSFDRDPESWGNARSPELELETTLLMDEVRAAMAASSKTITTPRSINEADPYLPGIEKPEAVSCSTAAFYSSEKDRTIVLFSTTVSVHGDHKTGYKVKVFQGAPFGHVYQLGNDAQFVPRPGQLSAPVNPEQVEHMEQTLAALEAEGGTDEYIVDALRAATRSWRHGEGDAIPLQSVSAVRDEVTGSYSAMDYDFPGTLAEEDDYINVANITSLRIWLQKADEPLDIY